jgi:DNA (cytosine-5)-methyltransferase 1
MSDVPKAISLFSGAGGMDIGVSRAGFDVLIEIESDPHCCLTLRTAKEHSGSSVLIIEKDIRDVDPSDVLTKIGLSGGELDLLFGGPPCQAFSQIGKKGSIQDERGILLFQIPRFAEVLQPKAILVEQVKGLLTAIGMQGKKGEVFDDLVSQLQHLGYTVKWQVVLAADFGVPQMRERLFIVAIRGANDYAFPERTHAPAEECYGPSASCKPWMTVGEALAGLGSPTLKERGRGAPQRDDGHVDATPARDRERIRLVPEGEHLSGQLHLSKGVRCGLQRKDTTKYLRLHRQRQANTLRCGEIFYHPTEPRYLTPREYMRLHGYPDDYLLKGPIRSRTGTVKDLDQHRQVANSVPPQLAFALASSIRKQLNEQEM